MPRGGLSTKPTVEVTARPWVIGVGILGWTSLSEDDLGDNFTLFAEFARAIKSGLSLGFHLKALIVEFEILPDLLAELANDRLREMTREIFSVEEQNLVRGRRLQLEEMVAAKGGERVRTADPVHGMGSEDYSEFVKAGVPSIFFAIGGLDPAVFAKAKAEKRPAPVNHSPDFAPLPEPTIKRGADTLALAVLMAMASNGGSAKTGSGN